MSFRGNVGIPRDRPWITSKIDPKVFCQAADPSTTALAMLNVSRAQRRTDYIDLALLHEPCDKHGKPHPPDSKA